MPSVLVSTTVVAAFLGGVVALLAPCCVSVLLPAYFATSFHRRSRILAMTLVFAAGLGTVIAPIALGATALSRLISGHHALVFSLGGAAMTAGGLAMLAGATMSLPMPGRGAGSNRGGVRSVYALGVFSGAASACCAPVLAGVAAVSGAAGSFPTALTVAVAYVFGMVAPLCALALVWDRRNWGASRLLSGRSLRWRLGGREWTVPLGTAASGALLVAMGALTVVLAARGPSMGTSGWQLRLTAWLGHLRAVTLRNLAWLPGWAGLLLVFGVLALLVWRSRPPASPQPPPTDGPQPRPEPEPGPAARPGPRARPRPEPQPDSPPALEQTIR